MGPHSAATYGVLRLGVELFTLKPVGLFFSFKKRIFLEVSSALSATQALMRVARRIRSMVLCLTDYRHHVNW